MNREDCLDNERLAAAMMSKRRTTLESKSQRSLITHVPNAVAITRKRTFILDARDENFYDIHSQLVVLLDQLHAENFTGQLVINFYKGGVGSVETTEKLPAT